VPTEVAEIRERLLLISEQLADLALDRLREAVDSGAAAPAEERRLTRARRAVEKAAALLAEDPGPEEV
jgi:hypothetical protein